MNGLTAVVVFAGCALAASLIAEARFRHRLRKEYDVPHYYPGKLLWIDDTLYEVESVGETDPRTGLKALKLKEVKG